MMIVQMEDHENLQCSADKGERDGVKRNFKTSKTGPSVSLAVQDEEEEKAEDDSRFPSLCNAQIKKY